MSVAQSSTIVAAPADPFVHLDNRAVVVSNGRDAVMFPEGSLRYVADTLQILHQEGRATRRQTQAAIIGGFRRPDGGVTLFAGPSDRLVTVALTADAFDGLRAALDALVQHG